MTILACGSDDLRLAETVDRLCFTDDGRTLVAISGRQFARRWLQTAALDTGKVVRGPEVERWAVDGDRLLAVSPDAPLVLRAFSLPEADVRETWTLPSPVRALAAADGRIAVGLDEAVLLLGAPGAPSSSFPVAQSATALAFSPDGSLLALGSETGAVSVLDLSSGEIQQAGSCRSPVTALVWSDDGAWIAVGGRSAWVFPSRGPKGRKLASAKRWTEVVGFGPTGLLLVHWFTEKLAAIDPATGAIAWEVPQYGPAVLRGDRLVAARFEDLRELDPATGDVRGHLLAPSIHVSALALAPDGAGIALAQAITTRLRLGDPTGWRAAADGHGDILRAVCFADDGRFATGAGDRLVTVWRRGETRAVQQIEVSDSVGAVHLDGDTTWIGCGSRVLRWREGLVAESAALPSDVKLVLPLPDGSVVVCCEVSGSTHARIALLDPRTLELLWSERIGWSVERAEPLPDGRIVLGNAAREAVLDPVGRTLEEKPALAVQEYYRRQLSTPDRRVLVTLGNGRFRVDGPERGQIEAIEVETGRVLYARLDEEPLRRGCALDPSGERLATAHDDGQIRLWDVQTCILQATIAVAEVDWIRWFPDGRSLLVAADAGRLFEVSLEGRGVARMPLE